MEYNDIKRLALVYAVQAEVEGMKFENMQREQFNETHAFTSKDFESKASELENLAHASDELLTKINHRG